VSSASTGTGGKRCVIFANILLTSKLLGQYRRTLRFLRPYTKNFILLFVISLVSTGVTLAQPYLTKLLIDHALLHRDMHDLWALAGWMAVCSALSFALGLVTTRWYTKLSACVLFDMRGEVFRRLQFLSPRFYSKTKTGDIVSRLNGDISELQRLSSDTLLSVPSNALFLIGSIGMMAYLDLKLLLVCIALTPLGFWAMQRYQGRLRDQVKTLREQSADIGNFLIEAILSMRLIVCSNGQQRKNQEFRNKNNRFVDSLLKLQVTSFMASALPGAVLTLSTASLFLLGGSMVIRGTLTIGGLMAFMAYYSRLLSPVQSFMGSYSSLVTGSVSLQRVFQLLDMPAEVEESLDPVHFASSQGEVEFQEVTFAYDTQLVLNRVSFQAEARSVCVLVGSTGAGKSTVIDLLVRFYDPSSGAVLLDGVDVRRLSFSSLRDAIAVVDQAPFLFHASIRENLLFAAPNASEEDLREALKSAGIADFIDSLPARLEATVGERGLSLSAGQRQRLAIARALLRKPSVLVLDEPSSALDPTAEFELGETLRSVASKCTVLVVTHRPALLEIADRVIVLDAGRIVEQGRPRDLRLVESALSRHFRETASLTPVYPDA
jgi:ATP-binding cassette subfamily B protein